jgi:hypothetical protein
MPFSTSIAFNCFTDNFAMSSAPADFGDDFGDAFARPLGDDVGGCARGDVCGEERFAGEGFAGAGVRLDALVPRCALPALSAFTEESLRARFGGGCGLSYMRRLETVARTAKSACTRSRSKFFGTALPPLRTSFLTFLAAPSDGTFCAFFAEVLGVRFFSVVRGWGELPSDRRARFALAA